MRSGFFSDTTVARTVGGPDLVPKCGACGLYRKCKSPKIQPIGDGRRRIMLLGEAPGREEDEQGVPLTGPAWRLLRRTLTEFGIDPTRDTIYHNAVICHPPKNITPDATTIGYCHPNVNAAIEKHKPHVIIPMGGVAVQSALRGLWGEDPGGLGRWVGWQIPVHSWNAWVCPTYHPAHILRTEDAPTTLWWRRHLEAALELRDRPWRTPPDFAAQIQIIKDPDRAAKLIHRVIEDGGSVAFDYETDRLKPDHAKARIVSAAVCLRGRVTFAYPWHGAAIAATQALLRAPCHKIAANLKFEERWTRRTFGHGVRGWWWDTMLAAHLLDNRRGICGLKFQAFVLYGVTPYNTHIEPYFQTEHSNAQNRIREIDLDDLLLYNGMDALLEYKVAARQRVQMGL